MRARALLAITALLPALSPAASRAQSTAAPARATPEEPIEVVVTGTRTPESSQRATVRTDVLTREEAERRGATNVGEALGGQLGVQVSSSGARGGGSAIQMQGFDRERVLVLEDGERVIGDTGGVIDLSMIPLTDVSRVELVAGPTSSLYGTSAIGGVVNVLSAPPAHEGPSGRARIEGRSRRGLLMHGSGAYRSDERWAGADVSFQREDGVQLDERTPSLARPARSQRLLGLRAGTALGARLTLRLRARWTHDEQDGIEQQVVPGLGAYVIDLPEVTDRIALHLTEEIDLGGGSNLRVTAGRQWALGTSDKDRRDSPVGERRERSAEMQSLEVVATAADGPSRTWVAGARAEVEQIEQRLSRVEALPSGLSRREIVEVPETKIGSASVYGQLAWRLIDELTLMPGVRGEMHLGHGGVIAPRLAVAYRPSPRVGLRLSGGRGFRAPGAKEIGFSFDHSFYGYRVVGNPDLDPETSWGVNGDITFRPDARVTLRAGGFTSWIDDLIDIDVTPASSAGGVDTYAYRNIAAARTAGVEVQATLRAAAWLRAEAGYAYLWTRDDTNERPLEGRPPHTVMAALRAELPWSLELALRFRAVTGAFLDEDLRTPGFSTLDARLARALWPGAQAYVGAQNVLGVQKDPHRSGDQRPIEGRTIYLGVVAELPWEGS